MNSVERSVPSEFRSYQGADTIEGPKSVILVGVHGNEKPGIIAYQDLQDRLHIEQGQLWVAYGNPLAIAINERKVEADLNRMFLPDDQLTEEQRKSYEKQRAEFLKTYLNQSDALLDVHGTKNPEGVPFVIAEPRGLRIAATLPFEYVVSGFDQHEPGGTDYYMNTVIGKIGICAESGYNEDPESVARAKETMLSFLKAQGHISGKDIERIQKYYRLFYMHLTKTDFTRTKNYADFEPLHEGQVIGTDGNEEVKADRESVILFGNMDTDQPNEDVFVLAQPTPTLV